MATENPYDGFDVDWDNVDNQTPSPRTASHMYTDNRRPVEVILGRATATKIDDDTSINDDTSSSSSDDGAGVMPKVKEDIVSDEWAITNKSTGDTIERSVSIRHSDILTCHLVLIDNTMVDRNYIVTHPKWNIVARDNVGAIVVDCHGQSYSINLLISDRGVLDLTESTVSSLMKSDKLPCTITFAIPMNNH